MRKLLVLFLVGIPSLSGGVEVTVETVARDLIQRPYAHEGTYYAWRPSRAEKAPMTKIIEERREALASQADPTLREKAMEAQIALGKMTKKQRRGKEGKPLSAVVRAYKELGKKLGEEDGEVQKQMALVEALKSSKARGFNTPPPSSP